MDCIVLHLESSLKKVADTDSATFSIIEEFLNIIHDNSEIFKIENVWRVSCGYDDSDHEYNYKFIARDKDGKTLTSFLKDIPFCEQKNTDFILINPEKQKSVFKLYMENYSEESWKKLTEN